MQMVDLLGSRGCNARHKSPGQNEGQRRCQARARSNTGKRTIETHRVVLFSLQGFPVNNWVHAREIGDGAGVEFPVHVHEGAVVLGIVRAHRLAALLRLVDVFAGLERVVPAHGLERVRAAHQQTPRARLHQDADVILTRLVVLALDHAHLHVLLRRVPRQPLLLRQVRQAQIVHQVSAKKDEGLQFPGFIVIDCDGTLAWNAAV